MKNLKEQSAKKLVNQDGGRTDMLEKIATEAGVSKRTVHRILEGVNKEVWPSIIRRSEKIRKIAAELGYRPNTAARAVATGQFHAVGLILSSELFRSTLPHGLLKGICEKLADHNLHLMLSMMPDETLASASYVPKLLGEKSCDGILLNYHAHIPPHLDTLLTRYHVPVIWTNAKRDYDSVYPDDFGAGRLATRLLIDAGHRRIAYLDDTYREAVDHDILHYSKPDRMNGYLVAMEEAKLSPKTLLPLPNRMEETLRKLLSGEHRPTALVVYGDPGLVAAHLVARQLHLTVPRDLSMVTFGSQSFSIGELPMTVLVVPNKDVGTIAVEMLLQKIGSPEHKIRSKGVPFSVVAGASVFPCEGAVAK